MKNRQNVLYFRPVLFRCFEKALMPFSRRERGSFFTIRKGMGK